MLRDQEQSGLIVVMQDPDNLDSLSQADRRTDGRTGRWTDIYVDVDTGSYWRIGRWAVDR